MGQTISIIGCGRVGTALAVFLSRAGYALGGLYSRTPASSEKTAGAAGAGYVCTTALGAVKAGGIIFITTPDNIIEQICGELAPAVNGEPAHGIRAHLSAMPDAHTSVMPDAHTSAMPDVHTSAIPDIHTSAMPDAHAFNMEGKIFYHCSGALSSAILGATSARGAWTGSIHPLQSFVPHEPGRPSPFNNINISVEGDPEAVKTGLELIESLGAKPFSIPTDFKTLYHASAVAASNYLVTLEDFALHLLKKAGISSEKAYEILEPLIQGTLDNIKKQGTARALTGPVARGDVEIVERHIRDIDCKAPFFSDFYKIMGRYTLELARQEKGKEQLRFGEMERLFR
ncbi:MAG: DUF2520 domain-containing protein [Desulfamplus sp.]|nr:DUF2520 domain-containing protein [Desulfamplus sp.]